MSSKRVVTRAVAVSSGALMAGALGIGTASVAVAAPTDGGATNPLGGVVSTVNGTLNGTVSATTHATKQATKALRKSGKKLPKPLDKAVQGATKDIDKTVGTVQNTVNKTLQTISGTAPGGSPSHPKSPKGNKPGSAHKPGTAAAGRHPGSGHRQHSTAGGSASMPGLNLAHFNQFGAGAAGSMPDLAAGQMPSVAQMPGKSPAVAKPEHSLGYDLIHPSALIPRLQHDTTLQLELLIVAGALAGVVAGGHARNARRRLQTIKLDTAARAATAGGPHPAEPVVEAAPEPVTEPVVAAPAPEPTPAPVRRRFIRRPGHALG